jgi:hypothetical protein
MAKVTRVVVNKREERRLLSADGPLGDALVNHFAPPVVESQKANAAVDTGRMRDSVTVFRGEEDGLAYVDIGPTAVDPKSGFPYPVDQEIEHPFIRPSLDALPES